MDEIVKTIISAALAGDSIEVKENVEKAIGERVANQLEMKKIDIARTMIGQEPNMALVQAEGANNTDLTKVVHKSPWDKGVKKIKKEDVEGLEELRLFINEEYEMDIEDIEELELILEDMAQDDLMLIQEDFEEARNASR